MSESQVLAAWRSGAADRLEQILEEEVVFSSPYTDYVGRAAASHVLRLVATTLEDVRPGVTRGDDADSLTTFTAHVSAAQIEGVIREQGSGDGLTRVTLFLRPFESLRIAMRTMADLLEHDPIPSG